MAGKETKCGGLWELCLSVLFGRILNLGYVAADVVRREMRRQRSGAVARDPTFTAGEYSILDPRGNLGSTQVYPNGLEVPDERGFVALRGLNPISRREVNVISQLWDSSSKTTCGGHSDLWLRRRHGRPVGRAHRTRKSALVELYRLLCGIRDGLGLEGWDSSR